MKQSDWWHAGSVPLFDLQAGIDPFMPEASRNDLKTEFPDRVTIAVIPNASHALLPEQPAAVVREIAAWVRKLGRVPRAVRHEVLHCRRGIAQRSEPSTVPGLHRITACCGAPGTQGHSATTLFLSTPIPEISISQRSPGFMFSGMPSVPIHITSPGSMVQYLLTSEM